MELPNHLWYREAYSHAHLRQQHGMLFDRDGFLERELRKRRAAGVQQYLREEIGRADLRANVLLSLATELADLGVNVE